MHPLHTDSDLRLQTAIIANMFAGVALVRASDATIIHVNPRFREMFGYGPGELEGQEVAILNAPAERSPEDVAADIISSLQTDGVWKGEVKNLRKDGTGLWCLANVTAFEHPAFGDVWVVVQLDITAQKSAEHQLRKSEERLGLVLQVTGGGAWDWNIQTGEVYFSRYWSESLGYAPDDVVSTASFWESIIHPDDVPRVRSALAQHFKGRTSTYECVNRLRLKDGRWRWNLGRGQVVGRTSGGYPVRMVGTDTDLSQQRWSGLKEMLSVCSGCKKIRAESGQWRALEAHFGESSRAQFSHGICPDCVVKYFETPRRTNS